MQATHAPLCAQAGVAGMRTPHSLPDMQARQVFDAESQNGVTPPQSALARQRTH